MIEGGGGGVLLKTSGQDFDVKSQKKHSNKVCAERVWIAGGPALLLPPSDSPHVETA